MADITVKVIEAADSYDLMSLDELKLMIGIPATDTSEDEILKQWITHYSDVIATMCNRVFAKEKVAETWRGDLPPYDTQNGRVYLTHYPVADDDIESVTAPDGSSIDPTAWEIENRSGKLQFFNTDWSEPIRITYTGGYDLPDECPPALKQALTLLISSARVSMKREITSGIRSISHRELRVQFFDAAASAAKAGGNPLAAAGDTVNALLYHYMRFYV